MLQHERRVILILHVDAAPEQAVSRKPKLDRQQRHALAMKVAMRAGIFYLVLMVALMQIDTHFGVDVLQLLRDSITSAIS
ncbi:hypothetical protein CL628_02160 [bacterium]|nr:hypothetical protein [bacterium]|tara:strand:+ start:312 stop:551 length:240 start_codon:yes stop_codon:yes gene_type:complete